MNRRSAYFNNNHEYQISFAEGLSLYQNNNQYKQQVSSFIQCQSLIQSVSKEKTRKQQPIHNLHYQYIPANHLKSKKEPLSNYNIVNNPNRDKIDHINQKIDFILYSIESEHIQKSNQPFQRQQISQQSLNKHKISQLSQVVAQSQQNTINQILKTPSNASHKHDYSSSFKKHHNYSNMSQIQTENKFKTPVAQLHINRNYQLIDSEKKRNIRTSIYSNYSAKSTKSNKSGRNVIVNGKNIDQQINKLECKAEALNNLKKSMKIDLEISLKQKECNDLKKCIRSERTPLKEMTLNRIKNNQNQKQPFLNYKEPLKSTSRTNMTHNHLFNSRTSSHLSSRQSNMKSSMAESEKNDDVCVFNSFNQNICLTDCCLTQRKQKNIIEDVNTPKILKKLNNKKNKKVKKENLPTDSAQKLLNNQSHMQSTSSLGIKQKPILPSSTPLFESENNFKIKKGSIVRYKKSSLSSNLSEQQQGSNLQSDYDSFLLNLASQISYDQCFRKIKQWFHRLKQPNKWSQLIQQISKKSIIKVNLSEKSMKTIFTIRPQEQNSFYTPQPYDYSYQQLIKAYQDSQDHWKQFIYHQYKFPKNAETNLKENNVDLRKRGYISPEDLLRFFNSELDAYYRIRDIYLIYQRFKTTYDKLSFSDIISCLEKY